MMLTIPPRNTERVARHTRKSLAQNLTNLGLSAGDTVLVHSSLRSIGPVQDGARDVVRALLDAAGADGTVVVPTQTLDNRDPSTWRHAPAPEADWPMLRETLPPFDPATTPSTDMGQIAECVRTWPGAVRSAHPLTSFASVGPKAADLMRVHSLSSILGEESPLAELERIDARILLLGVGFEKCTAFHLAEYRSPVRMRYSISSVMRTARGREWVSYETIKLDDRDFDALGAEFETQSGSVVRGAVGAAESRLFSFRDAVRFATEWITHHRPAPFAQEAELNGGEGQCL